ncbi:MAG TPA: alginate lyase family protein [Asticcacaulis sp.]|nr:alginate lyase family protein [Asticcacaulis sp.]
MRFASLFAGAAAGLLFVTSAQALPQCKGADGYAASFGGRSTYQLRPDALLATKARIDKDPKSVPAYAALIADADRAMTRGPWSVMDKTSTPPSGDKHDYISMGPYFWPDPTQPDGLPYIDRDGETNPERGTAVFDRTEYGSMTGTVSVLAQAYYFSGDEKYAKRAALILKTWFLDPATRMNPNLNFGQSIPGAMTGRAYGLIDSNSMVSVVEAIGLLAPSHALSDADMKGLRLWFGDFVTWMTTNRIGTDERDATNNHAIIYDVQLTEFALFSGKVDVAKRVANQFAERRIDTQMAPDGSLPRELARTLSFHYSVWAFQAVLDEATLSECVGVDLWHYSSPEGLGIKRGLAFLQPYIGHERDWKWKDLHMDENAEDTSLLYGTFLKAARGYRDPALAALVAPYGTKYTQSRLNLTVPPPVNGAY